MLWHNLGVPVPRIEKGVSSKKSRLKVQAAGERRHWFDCMDRCSHWPDQERLCPTKKRVERTMGRIVMVLSGEGQLIALLDG
jgi:hypothetical protein